MKLNKLRDQLRKAQREQPETFVPPEDDETLNCAICGGRGVVQRGLDDVRGHQCDACGGTGLRLAGEKAAPEPRKKRLPATVAKALAERLASPTAGIRDLRITLVSEQPRGAPTLADLDPDTVLADAVPVTGLVATPTSLKGDRVQFTPKMIHEDKRGFPIAAAVVSSEGQVIGVIDLARGGIGIIPTGADILIEPILELAT